MSEPIYVEFFGGPRDGEILALPQGGEQLNPGYTLSLPCMWAKEDRLIYGDVTYRHDGYVSGSCGTVRLTYVKTALREMP